MALLEGISLVVISFIAIHFAYELLLRGFNRLLALGRGAHSGSPSSPPRSGQDTFDTDHSNRPRIGL